VALAAVACALLATSVTHGDERSFTYAEVIVPGATLTNAQGINAGGDIVGWYRDAANVFHGFVAQHGAVTTIDYPGAAYTDLRGIGPSGVLIGNQWAKSEVGVPAAIHGFVLERDGTFRDIVAPDRPNSIAQRILPDGTVLGCIHNQDTMASMVGFMLTAQGYETIDTFASMHNGATPDRRLIVGLRLNMMTTPSRQEGYTLEDGQFVPFVVPGSDFTTAWDVNPRGEIVGVYRDAAAPKRIHGYLRDGDQYIPLDVPGATATRAFGINAGGDVVGAFLDAAGVPHAFLATPTRAKGRSW
jgi:probable HAF family extracellular repeat protein